ncbi:MAG: hypothetical protein KI793_10655 [Rivularia sp. (in: Bacteria)]|nr:hypothetical protein [Rivularia sp. MS3]
MTEFHEMLNLLEAERERYILEAGRLERRLQSIRTQVSAIDNLISGYIEENLHHKFDQHFPQSETQAYLEAGRLNYNNLSINENTENQSNSNADFDKKELNLADNYDESPSQQQKLDISDIPKMKVARQSESLPMLPEYKGYSIKNAVLILMRRQPENHFHIHDIVDNLYRDNLTRKQRDTARVSVTKALSLGFKSGLWFKVLHSKGVYTLTYKKGVTAKTPKD